jgi:hypothetical protein
MDLQNTLPFIFFALIIGFFLFRIIKKGGLRGALFGARIKRTVGEVEGKRQGPVGVTLKVHVLDNAPAERTVGVEIVAKSFASYQMLPITLSKDDTGKLVELLKSAMDP